MQLATLFGETRKLLGIPRNTTSHLEKLLSTLGAGLGILAVCGCGLKLERLGILDRSGAYLVIASMGASAVLLFSIPHGALSQPWALIGGNLVSAIIGVSCYQWLGNTYIAAALAVALAVGTMYYLRCIHPPGGATALTAVIGGASVSNLGYQFVLVPVLMNVFVILAVAVAFNFTFTWRRYPAHLYFRKGLELPESPSTREIELTQEDLSAAIQKHDSFVDITEEGLTDLLELAKQHAELNVTHPKKIEAGRFYSNGKLGKKWSIRQVIDAADTAKVLASKDKVIFKVVAGDQAYITDLCLREEFKHWARFEVVQKDNRWIKVHSE